MKPTLIIATGPQGSGNHLFAKAFGAINVIKGWDSLKEKYWEGHDMEPFSNYWKSPAELENFNWAMSNFFYTSISCPYFDDGIETLPNYQLFHNHALKYANVKYLIIGRDQNILQYQQERVRGKHTTSFFIKHLDFFKDKQVVYASQEMLYLYKINYLQWLAIQLNIPVNDCDVLLFDQIIEQDANEKYLKQISHSLLDDTIKLASSKKGAV